MKTLLLALTNRMERVERFHRFLIWMAQSVIFALSGIAAFLLRFDGSIPTVHLAHLAKALPIWLVLKTIVFRMCGLDRGWWRFVSVNDVVRIGVGNLLGSFGGAVFIAWLVPRGFPRSIYFLDCLICFLATAGVRVCARIVQESVEKGCKKGLCKRVVIYGAGAAGVMLLREIRSNPALHYRVCGFVDDRSQKRGLLIQGSDVLGAGSDLAQIVRKQQIEEVLVAIPSATGGRMAQVLRYCHQAGVRCRTIPALAQTIEGQGLASQIRDVAVEDLLGRTPVHLNDGEIRVWLKGKVVAVTGAAGSIGSELCRQIARFRPRAIIGFDIAETPLFYLHREMQRSAPDVPFHAEIGSIQSSRRLAEVFREYSVSIVYHAAAYKHVPMMEGHVFEALEHNVFGTYNVAVAAAQHGVEDFVMISSDKAVRPTSIMGATKRLAMPACSPGFCDGEGRRDLRAEHGGSGKDRGSGPEPDSTVRAAAR
ncbi:MAG: polysaccharide biosynthesis protein [Acidobacteria bacterium]|nr:polysaccharide biosynthesis protein [Acidobacteriota bacterium]